MHVLSVTSEFFPLIKTGGLADVAGALPAALAAEDVVMRTLLPGYPKVLEGLTSTEPLLATELFGGAATLLSAKAPDGVELIVVDAPHLYNRHGNPYTGPDGKDWPDNHRRYAALAWLAAEIGRGLLEDEGYRPDIIHGHDWQAALAPVYLEDVAGRSGDNVRPGTILTIHNLAFQGIFPGSELSALKLPETSFTIDGLEFWGKISFLKGGIRYADRLTTVSPTYAREICRPESGMGLDGVLRERQGVLTGITNGIDAAVWNPADDPHITKPYNQHSLSGKAVNKAALQDRFGLDPGPEKLLFCVVSRLTAQKGYDLLLEALPTLLSNGGQLALLGSGDAILEDAFAEAVREHPRQIGAVFGYDEPLSHQLQAGADAILVPSRFEPCGLTQLYGLRYGTLPIVARVGGLADTVIDANQAAMHDGVATGIQFEPDNVDALCIALERAFALYRDQDAWQQVQRRAMDREVEWSASAKAYADLYRQLRPTAKAAA